MCSPGQPTVDVAVKILKDDDWCQPSLASIEDFKREVKIVSSFDHDNILRLIAIVPIGEMNRWIDESISIAVFAMKSIIRDIQEVLEKNRNNYK